jgi:hypothetical protein
MANISVTSDPGSRALIARAFAKAMLYDESLFYRLRLASMHDAGSYISPDLMHVAWAFGVIGEADETPLFRRILEEARGRLGRVALFRTVGEPDYLGVDYWVTMLWSAAARAPQLAAAHLAETVAFLESKRPSSRSLEQLMIVNDVCRVWPAIPGAVGLWVEERRNWLRVNPPSSSRTSLAIAEAAERLLGGAAVEREHFHEGSGCRVDILIRRSGAAPVALECDEPRFHPWVRDLDGVLLRPPGAVVLKEAALRGSSLLLARVSTRDWHKAVSAGTAMALLEKAIADAK